MLGQLEAVGEVTGGDAAMQIGGLRGGGALAAGDLQAVLFDFDLDFRAVEAGHRHGDAVGVLAEYLDVVGGVAGLGVVAQRVVEHACHAVKADGRAVQGGEVELVHGFLILEDQAMECARAR